MLKEKVQLKKVCQVRLRKRIRKKIKGSQERPRVFIRKSNRYIYIQAVDDEHGAVLASVTTLAKEFKEKSKNTKNIEASRILGEMMAKGLKNKKILNIVFDRGFYRYHGRVKALAEAMRKEGLQF